MFKLAAELILSIATHPKRTSTTLLATVVAAPAVFLVGHCVHNMTIAAYLPVLAFRPTFPAVEYVRLHIHTLVVAAMCSWAIYGGSTNLRVLVT